MSVTLPATESYSSLAAYAACPLRYRLRYIDHLRGSRDEAVFAYGTALHAAFEAWGRLRLSRPDATDAEERTCLSEAFARSFTESGTANGDVDGSVPDAAFDRFLANERLGGCRVAAVEVGFGYDWPVGRDTLRITGYVDRINRLPDGSFEIIDYKSGRAWSMERVDRCEQLSLYALAALHGAVRTAEGERIDSPSMVGLYFAEAGVTVRLRRTEDDLRAFERDLERRLLAISASEFAAKPSKWNCRWCEFRDTCAASVVRPANATGR
jgi:DNA helicase-2/ATP-dependent DNA helicase PcrA